MFTAFSVDLHAQSGGRKREGSVKRKRSSGVKSKGNADEFARGNSGRRGRFARLFKKDKPAWQYKSSGSARSHQRENRFLFKWTRSKGRAENAATQERQKKIRNKERIRGNRAFRFRKHKR